MQETNKLSYDDTYLMVFDGGSQALVHTDKFAQQKNFAQLATDAAGVPVGLSGGTPTAGVPFGPPATIFRLRMRCAGGAASVTLVATRRSGGSESFLFSLASGDDVSESIFASDYSSLIWYSAGSGTVTVEII